MGGSKNMAISIAPEPTHGRSVIIYTGGKALTPTHPRPIPRVVAEQRARAAITRHTPPPAARPSPRRSWSSSRWPCAVPACRLFALPMYLGRRIRQPRHIGDGAPPGAPVRSLRVLPLHSPRGPSPAVAAHGPWDRQLVRNSAHLTVWVLWRVLGTRVQEAGTHAGGLRGPLPGGFVLGTCTPEVGRGR